MLAGSTCLITHVKEVAELAFCIEQRSVSGVINAVLPEPMRNKEFASMLV